MKRKKFRRRLLMDANHGNKALLKPYQFKTEIRQKKGRADNEMQAIYHQLRTKGLFVDNKLVMYAKIPLLSLTNYTNQ